jgi:putative effector of murein hydrolase
MCPLGFTVIKHGEYAIKVAEIDSSSILFRETMFMVGMVLMTINGMKYTSFEDGVMQLKNLVGQFTIVCAFPLTKKRNNIVYNGLLYNCTGSHMKSSGEVVGWRV